MIGPKLDLSWPIFATPFSNIWGMERKRRVWPVGAVSKTTTENLSSLTRLKKQAIYIYNLSTECSYM